MPVSLATRCTDCGTVFRVVRDQLLVSEGWVRCGRCDAVFDATQTLFDIDHDTPVLLDGIRRPREAGAAARSDPVAELLRQTPEPGSEAAAPAGPGHDPLADVVPADWHEHEQRRAAGLPPLPLPPREPAADPAAAPESPLLRLRSREPAEAERPAAGAAAAPAPAAASADAGGPTAAPLDTAPEGTLEGAGRDERAPSFVRAAERAAFWRRPAVVAAQAVLALLLAAALAAQAALLWRDLIAAHLPAALPALQALCSATGCRVQPLRRIELLSVDSSALNRVEGSALYRLQLVLRNRADTPLLMPALDLALTDNQGRLVARKVLQAADLGVSQDRLERGQELPIRVVLATGDKRVDGYTLELFYP